MFRILTLTFPPRSTQRWLSGTALDLEARDPGFETLWLQIIIFPNLGGASQGNRDVT